MTEKIQLMNARGTRDFPPEEKILRNNIIDVLRTTFEKYGYNPLETPILERFELFELKYGGGAEILKETFSLTDQGNRRIGLRNDLTQPFARFIGMNTRMKMPFKRYEIGRVFRDGPIKLGRYREFWQCDVDVTGIKSAIADAEILMIVNDVFKQLEFNIVIELSNRKILDGIMDFAGIPEDKRMGAMLSIDKLKKFGVDDVKKELSEKGIDDEQATKLINALNVSGNNGEKLNMIASIVNTEAGKEGVEEVGKILELTSAVGITCIEFNPSLARGLAYYTGPVYEVFYKDIPEITSSTAAGGRYDRLVSDFLGSKQEYPTTGLAFGLEVITEAIKIKKKQMKKSVVDVYIIPIQTLNDCVKIGEQLREKGINVDMDLAGKNISKCLDFANAYGIPYVLIIGENELKEGKYTLKNMKTGEEKKYSIKQLTEEVTRK